jgi:hypothetical protein
MINGHMFEAANGYAAINDLGEGVFARFICWAYTGSYSAAGFSEGADVIQAHRPENANHQFQDEVVDILSGSIDRPGEDIEAEAIGPIEFEYTGVVQDRASPDEWDFPGVPKGKKKKKGIVNLYGSSKLVNLEQLTKSDLKESFIRLKYPVQETSFMASAPRANGGPHEDYTNVFLSHARIYVFAEKYDIQPLKMLALQNLHQTLSIYTLYPERVGDITTLLQYSYANTAETDKDDEELRALLRQYVRYEMDVLIKSWQFKDVLLSDGGEIFGDFLKVVAKRI